MMTLEEAIKHAEAAAIENEKEAKRKREHGGWYYDSEARAWAICAEENRQLSEWLRELQERRKRPEQRWIPCSERLPDNRVDVLICYRAWQQYAKRYVYSIVNGWYARKHSVNENVFLEWEGDCDYKEDEDEFYIQEGWYEFTTQGNGDLMNWYIGDAEVVAWMPLPEPYQSEAERRTDG